jgi:hypothetical protein
MRVEVQVAVPKPATRVIARGEVPAEKLDAVAKRMRESPLREQLERMGKKKK